MKWERLKYARRHFCTKTLFHDGSILHESKKKKGKTNKKNINCDEKNLEKLLRNKYIRKTKKKEKKIIDLE